MTDDIDPKAWAEAVKAEHEGKPIWLHLAGRPAMVTLIRALLAKAACEADYTARIRSALAP